jgi:glutamate racemase
MTIGFFDSGIGGLRVMERVIDLLPQYDYVFFGDTEHVPYGDRPESEIYELTKTAIEYLFTKHDALMVIVACNTASSESLRRLQDEFVATQYPERRVLGVIIPTIETVVGSSAKRPLLIGTTRTIDSKKFERELEKIGASLVLETKATPELVPLIEEGKMGEACDVLRDVCESHIARGGDSLILGCTHYTYLTPILRERYQDQLQIISQDEIIPEKLQGYLMRHPEIEKRLSQGGTRQVFWSHE